MDFDTIIRGGTVVIPGQPAQKLDLAIRGETIAAHLLPGTAATARDEIDATGLLVLPGVIDPHTHFGLGDMEEDYLSESRAGALSGVTTVINYLMTTDGYDAEYRRNRDLVERQSVIDIAFHAVVSTQQHVAELDHYIDDLGITSYKFFMSFRGEEGAYIGIGAIDDGLMYRYLEAVARRKGAVGNIHAENIEVVWELRKDLQGARDDLAAWNESRPGFTEAEAVSRAILFGRELSAPTYIVHTSAADSMVVSRKLRELYDGFYIETCPHYLTHDVTSPVGTLGKQNPPLRTREDVESLWTAILDGTMDTVGSDHAARKKEKKQGTIWSASPGQPNMPMILPVMLSEGVRKRGLSLERMVDLISANPARIFGLWPRKGSLLVGADADIVLADPDRRVVVDVSDLQSRADYSIYEGLEMTGWPVRTILRGRTIAQDGRLLAMPGSGQYIGRSAEPASGEKVRVSR